MNVHSLSNTDYFLGAPRERLFHHPLLPLVPKLHLGTNLPPKLGFTNLAFARSRSVEREAVQLPGQLHSQVQLRNEGRTSEK
jgi:hypothetical protein